MPNCSVSSCKNSNERGFRLFILPTGQKNAARRAVWERLIGRSDLTCNAKICQVHFSEAQFETKRADGRKLLRWDAIPDLLLVTPMDISTIGEITSNTDTCEEYETRLSESNDDDGPYESDNESRQFMVELELTNDPDIKIEKLTKALHAAWTKCHRYKKRLEKSTEHIATIFNDDQLQFIKTGSHRGTEWTADTLNKGIQLYRACGPKGYKEILTQKLPYPSIRTIQYYKTFD